MKKDWYHISNFTPQGSPFIWFMDDGGIWALSGSQVFEEKRNKGYSSCAFTEGDWRTYKVARQLAKVAPDGTEVVVSQRFKNRKGKTMERFWNFIVKKHKLYYQKPEKKG